jgi:peroxiredoxin
MSNKKAPTPPGAEVSRKPENRWRGAYFVVVAVAFVFIYMLWFVSRNNPAGLTGKPAPEINAVTADGKEARLSDYRGKRVILVFWTMTGAKIKPEQEELRYLAEHYAALQARGIWVVAVNVDRNKDQAVEAVKPLALPYPSLFDPSRQSAADYKPVITPATFFIDEKGIVTFFMGAFHDMLKQEIEKWKP